MVVIITIIIIKKTLSVFYHYFCLLYYIFNLAWLLLLYPTPLVLPFFGFTCVVNHAENDDEVRIWPLNLVLKL